MQTRRPYISVRLALIAERFRAIVEETENCRLTMREISALSVSGHTLEEARSKFRLVLNGLRRKRKLPPDLVIRLVRPGRKFSRPARLPQRTNIPWAHRVPRPESCHPDA